MGVLQHLSSDKRVILAAHSVAGRLADSTIPLSHSAASKHHAAIFWTGRQWEARDLGSVNGTHLDKEKLASAQNHPVRRDSILRFGSDEEQWKLVDDKGPVAVAKCLESGVERYGESGVLALPSDADVVVTIIKDDAGVFFVDSGEEKRSVRNGERLLVNDQTWELTLPPPSPLAGTYKQPLQLTLDRVLVNIYVSLDQEDVRVEIIEGNTIIDLGRRSCFCALHVLARQLLGDKAEGQLSDDECGWMDVKALCRETAESEKALNVSINRIREEFKDAGVEDGHAIIDSSSRRGKRRLTISRIALISSRTLPTDT